MNEENKENPDAEAQHQQVINDRQAAAQNQAPGHSMDTSLEAVGRLGNKVGEKMKVPEKIAGYAVDGDNMCCFCVELDIGIKFLALFYIINTIYQIVISIQLLSWL